MLTTTHKLLCAAFAAILGGAALRADVVETKDGARIVGRITKADAGSIYMTTTYAGDIVIKQSQVASLATEEPVSVRLASGSRMTGTVTTTSSGAVQVTSSEGTLTTSVDKIAAEWPSDGKDPALAALERHWQYEVSLDINGTTGNKNQLGTSGGVDAKMVTPQDALELYSNYNRQVTDDEKSADQFKAGVDYSNNFEDRSSWYVRDEGGFDRIMDIRFYDTAAAGWGFDAIKNSVDTLTARIGLAYRYDGYNNPATPTVNSAAGDLEIIHDYRTAAWELSNKITVVPAFQNFNDVVVTQDSFYQVPLNQPNWKLRMGVSNDYNSEPGAGIKKLDTTYYTRLIYDWQ